MQEPSEEQVPCFLNSLVTEVFFSLSASFSTGPFYPMHSILVNLRLHVVRVFLYLYSFPHWIELDLLSMCAWSSPFSDALEIGHYIAHDADATSEGHDFFPVPDTTHSTAFCASMMFLSTLFLFFPCAHAELKRVHVRAKTVVILEPAVHKTRAGFCLLYNTFL